MLVPADKQVSNLAGDEACRCLRALHSAAIAAPPTPGPGESNSTTAATTTTAAGAAAAGAQAAVSVATGSTMTTAANDRAIETPLVVSQEGVGSGTDPAGTRAATAVAVSAPGNTGVFAAEQGSPVSAPACRRKVSTARHLVGHVVVMNFTARWVHAFEYRSICVLWSGALQFLPMLLLLVCVCLLMNNAVNYDLLLALKALAIILVAFTSANFL